MKSPVILCMGWRSYWCVLDEGMHIWHRFRGEDECGWFCEKHDRALLKYWKRRAERDAQGETAPYDWTEDDSLSGDTVRALIESLPKAEVVIDKPRVVIKED